MSSRRLAILRISEQLVLDFFRGMYHHEYLAFPRLDGLPADAKVDSVHSDWQSKSFAFTLQSESFPEVEDGCQLTVLRPMRVVEVRLKRESDTDGSDCPVYIVPKEQP